MHFKQISIQSEGELLNKSFQTLSDLNFGEAITVLESMEKKYSLTNQTIIDVKTLLAFRTLSILIKPIFAGTTDSKRHPFWHAKEEIEKIFKDELDNPVIKAVLEPIIRVMKYLEMI